MKAACAVVVTGALVSILTGLTGFIILTHLFNVLGDLFFTYNWIGLIFFDAPGY